ncbi:response regulator [Methylobacterium terricola]|uniref:Response regulator n=1 Tax=Methylobacterium terricola TaxID=2583531 RepID=A0A5C4L9E2_9HYPH|nr:response regulator [Methylobacterium terricola]TNC09079.1 response regulator [Methylobacterium terricola]
MPLKPGAVALVAEDEPLVRMEAADVLGDAGFDVLEASTTPAALAFLEMHPEITLLFTDVVMPGPIDGLALAHEVRRRWAEVKIIIVSGRVTPDPAQLPEGARFLEKPYDPNRVARMVREMGLRPTT